eukprot:CAMPEP_0170571716 /NCGR_PEP_ID=MMETSP0224-20130122/1833_1 /TAXON_ID=285029 /ORGANISM="Togula jolla, Strain CCCM 725" /LENGTH=70 /DNA_ID=CAMNT_0010894161 /DNA_START=622 /DNA_END=834 /DNA_ORIENTATION=-
MSDSSSSIADSWPSLPTLKSLNSSVNMATVVSPQGRNFASSGKPSSIEMKLASPALRHRASAMVSASSHM